ncbi:dihydroneopterin aldolase [Gellertiella hungarica]|uniref:7,8-dihydroneopterin aldolase n=1 Tax=Gellertiella hungarica TaxID=1572859 RepID=A0A7W6J4H1_9HYPH|nr:dihydroneopterin aldolase [Gellertiella hungarica]MBB4064603.1 dihydroneopterin aldolase [Gellertiella hungarica]
MSETYRIEMKNCAFFARHGVLSEEEVLGQRFFVDAALDVDRGQALEIDSIEDTVHYGEAFQVIEAVVMGKRKLLIESLALDIAKALCARFPQIRLAAITVRKPSAPIPGVLDHVQVTVTHAA